MVKCITVVHLLYSLYLHFLADGHLGFQYFAIMKNAVVSIAAGESHGQRSLAGYSLRGCKELDTTEQVTLSQSVRTKGFCEKSVQWSANTLINKQMILKF